MTRPITGILNRMASASLPQAETDRLTRCEGKDGFATQPQAMAVIGAMKLDRGGPINAYRCPYCRMWHVGRGKW